LFQELAKRAQAEAEKAKVLESKKGHAVPCIHDEKDVVEAKVGL
jgi:hypothetical protein